MSTIIATKKFSFEAAHYLVGYNGLCGSIHGHSYTLEVSVSRVNGHVKTTDGNDSGMVMEFGELKALVQPMIDELDHSLLCYHSPAWPNVARDLQAFARVKELKFSPTTENLADWLYQWLNSVLEEVGIVLVKIRLQETATGWVEVVR